jgi:hypothetical protein
MLVRLLLLEGVVKLVQVMQVLRMQVVRVLVWLMVVRMLVLQLVVLQVLDARQVGHGSHAGAQGTEHHCRRDPLHPLFAHTTNTARADSGEAWRCQNAQGRGLQKQRAALLGVVHFGRER